MTIDYECPDCGYEKYATLIHPKKSKQRECPDCGSLILRKPIKNKLTFRLKRKSRKRS